MLYQLLSMPGCDRQNIPNASSINDLVTSYGVGVVADLPRVAKGREITVNMSFEVGSDPPTHVVEYLTATSYISVYYITSDVKMTAITDEQEEHVYTAELCGVLTVLVNPSYAERKLWHLIRASLNDSLYGKSQTPEQIDGVYAKGYTSKATYTPSWPEGYYLAVTWHKLPANATGAVADADAFANPFTTVLENYYGSSGLRVWAEYVKTLGASELKYVYRVQMIPSKLHSAMVSDKIVQVSYYDEASEHVTLTFKVASSFDGVKLFSNIQYGYRPDYTPDNYKAWGEPEFELRHLGEVIAKWPCFNPKNPGSYSSNYYIRLKATIAAGINAYVHVTLPAGDDVCKMSLSLPEVQGVGDGLTAWWSGAQAQVLTTAGIGIAGAVISGIATKGASVPASLAMLGMQAAGTAAQAAEAAKQVVNVGSGAPVLYVTDPNAPPYVELREIGYASGYIAERDKYFKAAGYACDLYLDDVVPLFAKRRSFVRLEGDLSIIPASGVMHATGLSVRDIQEAANEELADGVYVWSANMGYSCVSVQNDNTA